MENLHTEIAKIRIQTLKAEADAWRKASSVAVQSTNGASPTLSLRLARGGDDNAVVHRLAQLDSRPAPQGDVLIAVEAGEPVAALSLNDGRVVADPFRPTAQVVSLLRVRAESIRSASDVPARRGRPHLRVAA